jgi:hypothetical protein
MLSVTVAGFSTRSHTYWFWMSGVPVDDGAQRAGRRADTACSLGGQLAMYQTRQPIRTGAKAGAHIEGDRTREAVGHRQPTGVRRSGHKDDVARTECDRDPLLHGAQVAPFEHDHRGQRVARAELGEGRAVLQRRTTSKVRQRRRTTGTNALSRPLANSQTPSLAGCATALQQVQQTEKLRQMHDGDRAVQRCPPCS